MIAVQNPFIKRHFHIIRKTILNEFRFTMMYQNKKGLAIVAKGLRIPPRPKIIPDAEAYA